MSESELTLWTKIVSSCIAMGGFMGMAMTKYQESRVKKFLFRADNALPIYHTVESFDKEQKKCQDTIFDALRKRYEDRKEKDAEFKQVLDTISKNLEEFKIQREDERVKRHDMQTHIKTITQNISEMNDKLNDVKISNTTIVYDAVFKALKDTRKTNDL